MFVIPFIKSVRLWDFIQWSADVMRRLTRNVIEDITETTPLTTAIFTRRFIPAQTLFPVSNTRRISFHGTFTANFTSNLRISRAEAWKAAPRTSSGSGGRVRPPFPVPEAPRVASRRASTVRPNLEPCGRMARRTKRRRRTGEEEEEGPNATVDNQVSDGRPSVAYVRVSGESFRLNLRRPRERRRDGPTFSTWKVRKLPDGVDSIICTGNLLYAIVVLK